MATLFFASSAQHLAKYAVVGVLACSAVTTSSSAAPLQLAECRLESAVMTGSAAARCGTIEVPEDRKHPDGAQVSLHVAVVPALRLEPEPDPLVVLTGGPGQAASDFYLGASPALSRIRRDRDIVVIDQRGTGKSHRLDCPLPEESQLANVDLATVRTLARECLESLSGDPRFYTTSVAVRDLEEVRAALGYEQLNLYGVSYGTRVAQHYMRRYPQRVRAAVLDGVVPPQLALGPHIAIEAQRALDAVFDRCERDEPCSETFPNVREHFAKLHERLNTAPLQLSIPHPITAELVDARLGREELNGAVRLLSYSDETAATLPLMIYEAEVAKRMQPLAAQYQMIKRSMETQLAYGMHFSVVCSEDAPRWHREQVSAAALEHTYIGPAFMTVTRTICDEWPRGPVDENFYEPLQSATPVLVLSGENDPVTPPSYAERILSGLRNSKHLILNGQGHGQLAIGCMPRVVARFIASASSTELGEKCLEPISAAPFMLSRTASAP